MRRLLSKGIEPIIAVVILVAVTLVIAIGVIGWIMGWWGTFGATESLQIYPDSYINASASSPYLALHMKNTGSATAVIYKVEISGIQTLSGNGITYTPPNATSSSTGEIKVTPGQEGTWKIVLGTSTKYVAGTNYQVKLYTRAGNVYSATIQAR